MYSTVNPINLLRALSMALELSSGGLSRHHWRTAMIASRIAEAIGMEDFERHNLIYATLLHDIGAASNWQEKGQLRIAGADFLYKHAQMGYDLLKNSTQLGYLAEAIRHHHDFWDGSSPSGLAGDKIPLHSRIIHLADRVEIQLHDNEFVFSQRADILTNIRKRSGTSFDPELVKALHDFASQESFWLDLMNPHYYQNFFSQIYDYGKVNFSLCDMIDIAEIFATIIDRTSRFTGAHSRSVASISAFLAEGRGFCDDEVKMMRIAGLLHDLGKLSIPSSVLEKPGHLSGAEFHMIKQHTYYTYRVLEQIEGFETIAEWAAYHHETLDGVGYPFRIPEKALSLGARIVAVADVFTALTETRPYRKNLTLQEVEKIMTGMVDHHKIDGGVTADLFSNSRQIYDLQQQIIADSYF
ncbi:MAG: HD domain-containing protein [Sporomusaceae bacterium]|nr:HD domain-containing protein [Sporomusaceae bacterium]